MHEPGPKERGKPKTQPSFSGGPPRPPKRTARALEDGEPHPDPAAFRRALNAFAARDERKAQLVKLLYLEGMTLSEAAKVLGVPEATARRDRAYALGWLSREMKKGASKKGAKPQHDPPSGVSSEELLKQALEIPVPPHILQSGGYEDLSEGHAPHVSVKGRLFTIRVFLPEARREEVEISTEARRVWVRRTASREYAAFESSTEVPPGYDISGAWAKYHSGVLRIWVPKYGDTWTDFEKELVRVVIER